MTLLAGTLGVEELASQIITVNVSATLFMVPLGIQEAAGAIVGNCIGANDVLMAKKFFTLISKLALVTIAIMCLLTILLRREIVDIFTQDSEVKSITEDVLLLMALFFIFDGMQTFMQGPIRAMGIQRKASYFAIATFYLIGIPLAFVLVFYTSLGLIGL